MSPHHDDIEGGLRIVPNVRLGRYFGHVAGSVGQKEWSAFRTGEREWPVRIQGAS